MKIIFETATGGCFFIHNIFVVNELEKVKEED